MSRIGKNPIAIPAGVDVTIDGQTGTHTEGRWVFALPDGTYSYSVRAFGYLEKTGELTVQGGTVDESVTLAAAARRSVTFTVTPADANAAVTVLWNRQAVAPESDGSYSLPYGDYQYLIKAKGFEDCMVYYDGEKEKVDVVIKTGGLLDNEVAQIRDIVVQETGAPVENIAIVEVK